MQKGRGGGGSAGEELGDEALKRVVPFERISPGPPTAALRALPLRQPATSRTPDRSKRERAMRVCEYEWEVCGREERRRESASGTRRHRSEIEKYHRFVAPVDARATK